MRDSFWQWKEADHKNRNYGPSVWSYYGSEELSGSSSGVIEYPWEGLFALIEAKARKFDLKYSP